jgi:hypothetical protein
MSNVYPFPTPARPEPTTPEAWQKTLFEAGDAVVQAQMTGGDVRKAKAEYDQIESRLPPEVRDALTHRVAQKDFITLIERGWDFLDALLKIKAKF